MRNLKYDMLGASMADANDHPEKVMEALGITYKLSTPQSMYDSWWFWGCENVPAELPSYIDTLKVEPQKAVGYGLSQQEADKLTTAIAPPVAAGSVDTPEFRKILNAVVMCKSSMQIECNARLLEHIDAWAAQQRAMQQEENNGIMREWAQRVVAAEDRAEKAEAALAVELERVQDYYTRWRCERENPTNTYRLDTWQAACGKARAERDKAEARVAELEAQLAAAKSFDLKA